MMKFSFLLVMILLNAWVNAETYTVTDKSLKATCTPRCQDLASPGGWRAVKGINTAGQEFTLYNTFALAGKDCHYHYFRQTEVGQCLDRNNLNIVIMGQSNGVGLSFTLETWFDRRDANPLDPINWLGQNGGTLMGTYRGSSVTEVAFSQVRLDANGNIVWKGGALQGYTPRQVLDKCAAATSTVTGGGYISFFRATQEAHVMSALDDLKAVGRAGSTRGYFMINMGSYMTDVTVWDSALAAILTRTQTEFPNYVTVLLGYTDSGKVKYNDVMKKYASAFANVKYLNTFDMEDWTVPNAPPRMGGHWLHITNHAIFQRVLSVACDNMPGTECDETVLGSSNCQFNSTLSSSWYTHWLRGCDYTTFTTPAGGSTVTLPAPAPAPVTVVSVPVPVPAPAPVVVVPPPAPAVVVPAPAPVVPVRVPAPATVPVTVPAPVPASKPVATVITPPIIAPAPTPVTTVPKPPAPTPPVTATTSCSNGAFAQCQGKNFQGQYCCQGNLVCQYQSEYWSSCKSSLGTSPCDGVYCSGHGWCVTNGGTAICACKNGYKADGPFACVGTTTTTTPSVTPSPTPPLVVASPPATAPAVVVAPAPVTPVTPVTPPASVPVASCAAVWKQCGGKLFTGPTACCAGSYCAVSNDYYSMCKPNLVK